MEPEFLMRIPCGDSYANSNLRAPAVKVRTLKVSQGSLLPRAQRLLNGELLPSSAGTKGCSRCRSLGVQEGHKKRTQLSQGPHHRERAVESVKKQFNKLICTGLRGERWGSDAE